MAPVAVFDGAAIRPAPNAVLKVELCAEQNQSIPATNKIVCEHCIIIPRLGFSLTPPGIRVRQGAAIAGNSPFGNLTDRRFLIRNKVDLRRKMFSAHVLTPLHTIANMLRRHRYTTNTTCTKALYIHIVQVRFCCRHSLQRQKSMHSSSRGTYVNATPAPMTADAPHANHPSIACIALRHFFKYPEI